MPSTTTNYVKKEQLYPSFGQCLVYTNGSVVINIREDLPQSVKDFLLVHETYHSTDIETIWWKKELKANWAGFKKEPMGFFRTLFMSLAWYRIKYYFQRWKNKN